MNGNVEPEREHERERGHAGGYGGMTTPNPDPTTLTTAQLQQGLLNLDRLLTTRIDGIEKAAIEANNNMTRVPTEVDKQIARLKELMDQKFAGTEALTDERFASVARDFGQRDKGVADLFTERDKSVQVALQAAEKAVGKQNEASDRAIQKAEDATTKSLDALQAIFKSEFAGLRHEQSGQRDLINLLQSRLDRGDGTLSGAGATRVELREGRTEQHQSSTLLVAIVAAVISFLSVATVVIIELSRAHP